MTRAAAWITLWDNMLERLVLPGALLDTALRALPVETDEQILQRVLAYVTRAFWRCLGEEERAVRAPSLEATLRRGLDAAPTASARSAWFATFRDVACTSAAVRWIERLWRRGEEIPGLVLSETDEVAMAAGLAIRGVPTAGDILAAEHDRIQNPDRRARFAFILPALSPDPSVREEAFARLQRVAGRRREPWVIESLNYLNHPLRESHAVRFMAPSLALLPEIQRTGDIFLPARWAEAVLSGHRSPAAASIVRDFLAREPPYPQRLRWIVLVATDELFRAADAHGAPPASVGYNSPTMSFGGRTSCA
jgi:aminopeptidase N